MNTTMCISHFADVEAPLDMGKYLRAGGLEGLRAAVKKTPKEALGIVKQSGLRRRGAAQLSL
ncbi:MAG TPA: hypothetical protein P5030_05190 [Rectinema sp.]|jgi:NADH:ubiquinone oxidoreductase subunit F (NADH-binding)|nr:hypothetical protein [Rectinema sp.]HOE99322.1 hypothetical protein [Rectinema sp.]HOM92684.1 hypothetical protein [Rectinema sp.]HOR91856.1 hypothetical protein [Rectinema sp.]HPK79591.1 hypothetical protein [Rectinema sp.]